MGMIILALGHFSSTSFKLMQDEKVMLRRIYNNVASTGRDIFCFTALPFYYAGCYTQKS